jgi:hypothetical protein
MKICFDASVKVASPEVPLAMASAALTSVSA